MVGCGSFSIEEAENKIKQAHRASQSFTVVASAFGLKNTGSPTKKQVEYADLWVNEWKFSPEMLREAYEDVLTVRAVAISDT